MKLGLSNLAFHMIDNKSSFLQTHGVNQTYALKRVLASTSLTNLSSSYDQQQVIIFANSWCQPNHLINNKSSFLQTHGVD
jgi:hypothetical protein